MCSLRSLSSTWSAQYSLTTGDWYQVVQRNAWFDNGYKFMSTIQGTRRFNGCSYFHTSLLLIAVRHASRWFEEVLGSEFV